MKRGLMEFPAVLSLLLALAMSIVWIHSYSSSDQLVRKLQTQEGSINTDSWQDIIVSHGQMRLHCGIELTNDSHGNHISPQNLNKVGLQYQHQDQIERLFLQQRSWLERLGIDHFEMSMMRPRGAAPSTFISNRGEFWLAPCWLIVLMLSVWPAVVISFRIYKRPRFAPGACPVCGYDLRATRDRCPECGMAMDELFRSAAHKNAHGNVG